MRYKPLVASSLLLEIGRIMEIRLALETGKAAQLLQHPSKKYALLAALQDSLQQLRHVAIGSIVYICGGRSCVPSSSLIIYLYAFPQHFSAKSSL